MPTLLAPTPLTAAERTAVIGDIEQFLHAAVTDLAEEPAPARGPGRPRVLPALCLWAGLLVCVLHGFSSYLSLWRLLSGVGLWAFPRSAITDQAL